MSKSNVIDHPLRRERQRLNLSQKMLADFCGLSVWTVIRAEKGQNISLEAKKLLCEYFGKSANTLGLIQGKKVIDDSSEEGGDDTNRREMLELLGMAGATLAADSLSIRPWEQLAKALATPRRLGNTMLLHLETITQSYWQLSASIASRDLLHGVLGHLQSVVQLLHGSPMSDTRQRLCSLGGEVAQIVGKMSFDLDDLESAQNYYGVSYKASLDACNPALAAVALGRLSFIPLHHLDFENTFSLLHRAQNLAREGATPATQSWLALVEAEVQATDKNEYRCLVALDRAQMISQDENIIDPYWTGFSQARVASYKGSCLVRLQQPKLAIPALTEALHLIPIAASRRQATVYADLAMAYGQRNEIEEACAYASKALSLNEEVQSYMVKKRVRAFRDTIKSAQPILRVMQLDDQLMVS